jgi:hypothetical protein
MKRLHKRCGTPVSYAEVSTGYAAQCPECDEDVYLIETVFVGGLVAGRCDCCQNNRMLAYYPSTDNYHCSDCRTEEEVVR